MHGTPTALRARDEGVEPLEVANRFDAVHRDTYEKFGISYDLYTSTHTKNHERVTHELFRVLRSRGYLYEATQRMPFSTTEGRFLSDRFVEGTCPHCGNTAARGDQCDNCGRTLDPSDLINIRSKHDGSTPVFRDTVHQLFKLSAFQGPLREWVSPHQEWRPAVRNVTLGLLNEGLHDRAVTRDIEWGVPVPLPGYEHKRIYVWFEAVMGYLSATIEWAANSGDPESWKDFWLDPAAESYYFLGKDNIPFHTVIWPAMIMGYNDGVSPAGGQPIPGPLNLPTDIVAQEFLNLGGGKFSKSRGNAVWLPDFLSRYDPEPLRYYLTSVSPETSDTEFSWQGFHAANNNELVATLGNFIHRVLTITHRNFAGATPAPGQLGSAEDAAIAACEKAIRDVSAALEARRLREGLQAAMALAQHGNRYVDAKAPWSQVKADRAGAATTLWTALNIVATLKAVLYPYLPESCEKTHRMLGLPGTALAAGLRRPEIKPGAPLGEPVALFKKLDDSIVDMENEKLGITAPEKAKA
jgi:methionyl-tRNA synthetase